MPNENRRPPLLTLEQVAQIAQETILRSGNHAPTLITEGHLSSVITQFNHFPETHEGRKALMFMRGLLLAQSGEVGVLQQAFFISEAWMSKAKKDKRPFVPPSQDPQREEVLIVARHVVQPPQQDGETFKMKRNAKARLIRLEPLDINEDSDRLDYKSPLMDAFIAGFLGIASPPNH